MTINIKGIKAQQRLFHNVFVNVYPTEVTFKEVRFWRDNLRTILDFDILETASKKAIEDLTLEEVTMFLVDRPDLELGKLAASIEKNGVRVPLIIIDDGTLLDGNRRFFAYSYINLKMQHKKQAMPKVLRKIPALIIKAKDIDEILKRKILAEANFVADYKVPWPLNVKAKVIDDYYQLCIKNKLTPEQAYSEIGDVYGVKRSDIEAYVETVQLSEEFINTAKKEKRDQYREIVQDKFVYFWEFRNKATKGRSALNSLKELPRVKTLFLKMIETQRFKNIKQVEPMIRAVRDKDLWALLVESHGSKIDMVEALYKENKVVRSAEDKLRNILKWITTEAEPTMFTATAEKLLEQLIKESSDLLKRCKK